MRTPSLALVCLLAALACERSAADPTAPEDEPAPAASPKPPASPPEPIAAERPDQPHPQPARLPALEAAALEAGVAPPGNKEVMRVARELGFVNPAAAAKPVGVAPLTYITAVRTREGDPARYTLELLVLRLPEAEATAWTAAPEDHHRVRAWSDEGWSDTPETIAVTLHAEDFDADGRPELLARFRYEEMRGGGGLNTFTDLLLLNLDPFTEALRTNLHQTVTVFETKGKASFPDLDHDGHPDLLVETRELEEDKQVSARASRWLWDAATDTYLAQM